MASTQKNKNVSASSSYFNFAHYKRSETTDIWDYEAIDTIVQAYKPKILIAGYSSYTHHYDYKRMREIIDKVDGYLMSDISHISGLVSAGLCPNPFDYSDVVMTTTHKTLGTIRNALIFFRKGVRKAGKTQDEMYDLETKINESAFPGHMGGPHNHAIAASAVGLKSATTPLYKDYQKRVLANAKVLCSEMAARGYPLVGKGTSNHMAVIDVKAKGVDGARVSHVCSRLNISVNKNVVPGSQNAVIPGGIRIGSPAMTTRGCTETDFKQIVEYLDKGIQVAKKFKKDKQNLANFQKEFDEAMKADSSLLELRKDVESFAGSFEFTH